MNPDLQAKLVKYLDAMEAAAQKATDFAATEVPEAVREWLLWLAIERFTYAVGFLAAAIVCVVFARLAWRRLAPVAAEIAQLQADPKSSWVHRMDKESEWNLMAGLFLVFSVAAVVTFGWFGYWTLQGVKVVVAPRVVLVEQVAGLAKSVKP